MKKFSMMLVGAAIVLGLGASAARALPPFKKSFDDRYVKNSGNAAFEAAFKEQGCNACHVKDKNKKVRNAYGEALAKLIEGDAKKRMAEAKEKGDDAEKAEMKKILGELDAAFTKVEGEKSASGETYGAMIKAGKLPGGN